MMLEMKLKQMQSAVPKTPDYLKQQIINRIQKEELRPLTYRNRVVFPRFAYSLVIVFLVMITAFMFSKNIGNSVDFGNPISIDNLNIGSTEPLATLIVYKLEISQSKYQINDEIIIDISYGHRLMINSSPLLPHDKFDIAIEAGHFDQLTPSLISVNNFSDLEYGLDTQNDIFEFRYKSSFTLKLKPNINDANGQILIKMHNYDVEYLPDNGELPVSNFTIPIYYRIDQLGILLSDLESDVLFFASRDRLFDANLIDQKTYIEDRINEQIGNRIFINLAIQEDMNGTLHDIVFYYYGPNERYAITLGIEYEYLLDFYQEIQINNTDLVLQQTNYHSLALELLTIIYDNGLTSYSDFTNESMVLTNVEYILSGIPFYLTSHIHEKFSDYQDYIFTNTFTI